MIDEKTDGIPTSTASETFIEFLGLRNRERRRLLVVKRTEAQKTVTSAFQFDEFSDDIDDIDAVQDFLYGMWCDQEREDTKEPIEFEGSFEEHFINKHPSFVALAPMPCRQ